MKKNKNINNKLNIKTSNKKINHLFNALKNKKTTSEVLYDDINLKLNVNSFKKNNNKKQDSKANNININSDKLRNKVNFEHETKSKSINLKVKTEKNYGIAKLVSANEYEKLFFLNKNINKFGVVNVQLNY